MSIGVAIGAITFTGSVIAFLKLSGRMSGAPITLPGRHVINIALAAALIFFIYGLVVSQSQIDFWLVAGIAFVFGVLIIIPIGGADMPVVISMLNSYSGWAAAGIGFTLGNSALIITGALVGSSGAILSYIMCKGMNRSFISVILGGFGGEVAAARRRRRAASGQDRLGRRRRLHHEERRRRSSSCRATAWRWRRRSTRFARWPTISRRRASRSSTPSIRWRAACPAT